MSLSLSPATIATTISAPAPLPGASRPDMPTSLRAASFLAPALFPTYQRIVEHLAARVGLPISLTAGAPLDDLPTGELDLAFLCGLQYVRLADADAGGRARAPVELLGAPVLSGDRYDGRPIYFSDIVVRHESPYACLDDLADRRFAYNERGSHSGYVVVRYSLLARGHTPAYFGEWIATRAHARSLAAVASGEADAAAIDSHVLAALLERDDTLAARLRIVGSFGPSTIPPLVVRGDLDADFKRALREVLLHMHEDTAVRRHLRAGLIDRFVAIGDGAYDDIRAMRAVVAAGEAVSR